MKKPILTKSIIRNAIWNFGVIVFIYILFHLFAFFEIKEIATNELKKKVVHEMEHFEHFMDVIEEEIVIRDSSELKEKDFQEFTENAYFLQIHNNDGEIVIRSKNMELLGRLPLINLKDEKGLIHEEQIEYKNHKLLICAKNIYNDKDKRKFILQLASPISSVESVIKDFLTLTLLVSPIILVIVILLSYFLSRRNYLALDNIIELAEEISAQNISKRLSYRADKNDVYGRLKDTLNNLFERLEKQINQMKEFSDNASHQLMSPLTAIKGEMEYIRRKERSLEEYKKNNEIVIAQTEKMISIVQNLLLMSKEKSQLKAPKNIFSLSKLIKDIIADNYNKTKIEVKVDETIYIKGSNEFFSIALMNLIDNAIKYSNNKPVKINASKEKFGTIIEIIDEGIGISINEKAKVFERFYRGENAINNYEGFGLGLSLVKSIIESMDGSISVLNNEPEGTIMRIMLPSIPFE